MIYRVKQAYWAVTSYFTKVDNEYVNKYLDSSEKELFNRLRHNEKQHCIRVSKEAVSISRSRKSNISIDRIAKASLLHDVGKSIYGLNIFKKSFMVIANKITRGKIKKYNKIKTIDIYYNHGIKGAELLKNIKKYDHEFLEVISCHHDKKNINNELLNIIRESDNKN